MVITDLVYNEIISQIATHAPELGGALYGPKNYPFVTHFEFDPDAETSAVSYVPSSRLIANVPRVESSTGLQFKGIIHSHPKGLIRPSGGDERTVASFFRLNPHFSTMALPIVQQLDDGYKSGMTPYLYWYRAERRDKPHQEGDSTSNISWSDARLKPVEVIAEDYQVLNISRDVEKVLRMLEAKGLELKVTSRLQHLKIQNAELVGLVASSPQGHEFMYFVSLDYPIVGPVILYRRASVTETLLIHWNGMANIESSLAEIAENLEDEWQQPRPSLASKLINLYRS